MVIIFVVMVALCANSFSSVIGLSAVIVDQTPLHQIQLVFQSFHDILILYPQYLCITKSALYLLPEPKLCLQNQQQLLNVNMKHFNVIGLTRKEHKFGRYWHL